MKRLSLLPPSYVTYIVLAIGTLTTLLLVLNSEWTLQSLTLIAALVGPLIYLALKAEGARTELNELHRLQAAYDQLDAQAKLIIRTDLELHHIQEAMDRRLTSLMSLHRFGRQLEVSLRPDEVFSKLDDATVINFGFSKGLLGMCGTPETVEWRSFIRVDHRSSEEVKAHLIRSRLLQQILSTAHPIILQRGSATAPAQQKLLELLDVSTLVMAGVLPHTGAGGCLLLGHEGGARASDIKADEELVSILTNQLAFAIDNSVLYEDAWSAQQTLERSVQERTRELEDANTELIRLNKAKSDFVSSVSHELRTPLAAIKGYASLLGSGQFGPLATPQHERIAKIEKHVDALTRFINNLLDIARIESGRLTMEHQPIPVKEFLAGVQEVVHPQLEAKRLRYVTESDGVTQLVGDTQHLQRVFVNLLSNAIKYTPEGGTIRVAFQRKDEAIVASVNDSGCGISAQELPKLFQEFYRANDDINQHIRGTGLGLALAKRIVEAHHGRIWVASERGVGSTFFVSLPAT